MGDRTSIAWTDATWNPLRGCTRVSEGCRHCYAEAVAARFSGPGQPYEGLATRSPARWTGQVRLIEEHLADPLRWQRPRRIFVNSMSDLFHPDVPFEWVAGIFGIMAASQRHIFQVLTKRPERMAELVPRLAEPRPRHDPEWARSYRHLIEAAPAVLWPLPNVWLGVSVENQATADARIPLLMATPAEVRFVSYEPALGPVDFDLIDGFRTGERCGVSPDGTALGELHWIIVGGESGHGARPFDVAWARSTVAQCREAGVACFVKQLGAAPVWYSRTDPTWNRRGAAGEAIELRHRAGADPLEWPEDLRVQQFPSTPATEGSR